MWHNQLIEIPCYEVTRNIIRDHFTRHWYWYANICNSSNLEYYCQFKTEFKMEKCVECISNDKLRSELTAFRLSAHNLDIERGQHINVPRENRICRLCSMSMVKSEFQFLVVCHRYSYIRRDFLSSTAWPSVAKFVSFMATNSKMFRL